MKKIFNDKVLIMTFVIVSSIIIYSCKPVEPPAPYRYEVNPKFTWGFAEFYGSYYSNYNITNNVITLNLFTEKLFVNENIQLDGVGQYLVIEDVFTAPTDTLLPSGLYKVSDKGEPFTFFVGKKFEDNRNEIPSGAYLYYIEADPSKSKISYVTDGTFNVSIVNDSVYNVQCDFILDGKTEMKGNFQHVLYHIDRTAVTPPSAVRRKLQIKNEID